MPRQPRLDAPGTLHHVIIRGIEKRPIVADAEDRQQFVSRLGQLTLGGDGDVACLFRLEKILWPSRSNCYAPHRSRPATGEQLALARSNESMSADWETFLNERNKSVRER